MKYLTPEEIIEINREIILNTGGLKSGAGFLSNPNSLYYLIEIINFKLYGSEIYPLLFQKASLYAYNIITRHIFQDGNKRTGMICAFYFLEINGVFIGEKVTDNEILETALGIANHLINFEELCDWFEGKMSE